MRGARHRARLSLPSLGGEREPLSAICCHTCRAARRASAFCASAFCCASWSSARDGRLGRADSRRSWMGLRGCSLLGEASRGIEMRSEVMVYPRTSVSSEPQFLPWTGSPQTLKASDLLSVAVKSLASRSSNISRCAQPRGRAVRSQHTQVGDLIGERPSRLIRRRNELALGSNKSESRLVLGRTP